MQTTELFVADRAKTELSDLINSGNIPHALLFSGPPGCGKFSLAFYLAKTLLCEISDIEPCSNCGSCLKAEKWIHPDMHFSFPVIGSENTAKDFLNEFRAFWAESMYRESHEWSNYIGAENKQLNINKKECQEIIHKIGLKAFEGKSKVLLLWLPEYLGNEGNRLLKLFEEPPANTFFILVTENKEKILNTIISRFQNIHVPPIPNELMNSKLIHDYGYSEVRAEQISFLSYGNYNKAQKLIKNEELSSFESELLDWFRICFQMDPVKLQKWIQNFSSYNKEQQKFFVDYMLEFLRTLHLMQILPREKIRFSDREFEHAQKLNRILNMESIRKLTEVIEDMAMGIERNANVKILLTERSFQVNEIIRPA